MKSDRLLHDTCVGPSDGPCVFFLHGIGTTSVSWRPAIELLAEFRCVSIDLPGHGESRDVQWHSMDDTAAMVRAIVEREAENQPAHLVGISLGAYIGLKLLGQAPRRFETAFLSGLHISPMPNRSLMRIMSWVMAPMIGWPFLARRNGAQLGLPEDMLNTFASEAARTRASAFRRASLEAVDFKPPTNLGEVVASTVIAAGEREHCLIRDDQARIVSMLGHGQAMTIDALGHAWPAQNPALFARVLSDHIVNAGRAAA